MAAIHLIMLLCLLCDHITVGMVCTPKGLQRPNHDNITDDLNNLMNSTTTRNYSSRTSYNHSFHFNKLTQEIAVCQKIEKIIYRYVIHFICMSGIVGNFINLIVLTRKSLTTHMERMEKSAHAGLIALAVSDFLFCLTALPNALKDESKFGTPYIDFWLVYELYGEAVINTFMLSSTWLTVAMAVSRYMAICFPLRARQTLGMTSARVVIIMVFLLSICFNLPRFWMKSLSYVECVEGGRSYFSKDGPIRDDLVADVTYMWLYFTFGIVVPLLLLTYCNIFLIKALNKSTKMRRESQGSIGAPKDSVSNSKNIVTLTLTIIVVFYIVLVGPAEVLNFWKPFIQEKVSFGTLVKYSLAIAVCNALQALNFAINFILYCIINVHFRKVIRELILCTALREQLNKTPAGYNSNSIEETKTSHTDAPNNGDKVDNPGEMLKN